MRQYFRIALPRNSAPNIAVCRNLASEFTVRLCPSKDVFREEPTRDQSVCVPPYEQWNVARIRFAVFLALAYALSIMNWQDYISITPGVRSGKPCVKGTRITVSDVLEYLAGGMDERAILADFPELRREHIQAVLGFAAERERRLSALPAVS
jgi:uncharacterized protein (DUF433 family)